MSEKEVIVSMKDICKSFPGVKALDHVQFELRSGEVMALLGENGAGKSTLMKILSGVYTRDSGSLEIFGKEYGDLTPKQAQEAGVAIIHQELNMCKHLSVAENMFLGREKTKGIVLANGDMEAEASWCTCRAAQIPTSRIPHRDRRWRWHLPHLPHYRCQR